MPTYEYECQSCHQRIEAVQKFSDPDLSVCAHCGGELRKVFSAVGIVFKGSGFYKTDSRGSTSSTTPSPASTPAASTPPAAAPDKSTPATSTASSD
ncbi:MAG: FmdB family zinc ribbon protein [Acidimicrobiales bacterium]